MSLLLLGSSRILAMPSCLCQTAFTIQDEVLSTCCLFHQRWCALVFLGWFLWPRWIPEKASCCHWWYSQGPFVSLFTNWPPWQSYVNSFLNCISSKKMTLGRGRIKKGRFICASICAHTSSGQFLSIIWSSICHQSTGNGHVSFSHCFPQLGLLLSDVSVGLFCSCLPHPLPFGFTTS